jgi:pimeloyl-ACP methyl ester carboxylesterase
METSPLATGRTPPSADESRAGASRSHARRRAITTVGRVTQRPVLLVHGWGGSFRLTWQQTPLVPLLEDVGRTVIGVDLLGHGIADKPHDPAAYSDLTAAIEAVLPDEPVDAVGFSLGAMTLLELARRRPEAFDHLVLAGVGESVFRQDEDGTKRIVAALEGTGDPDDVTSQLFRQYADQPGNDRVALAAVMKRPRSGPVTPADLATVTCPTLVVIGDKDFAGPGQPLADALPNSRLVTLRNVDHFATPEAFAFIDATLEFLGALPG